MSPIDRTARRTRSIGSVVALLVASIASASCSGKSIGPIGAEPEPEGGGPASDASASPDARDDATGGSLADAGAETATDGGRADGARGAEAGVDTGEPDAFAPDGAGDLVAGDGSADGMAPSAEGGNDGAASLDGSGAGPCAAGELDCSGICVPNDAVNCGSCGHDCTALHATSTVSCTSGQCIFPGLTCAAGWAHCSADAGDGCEVDVTTPAHCGGCTVACTSPPICSTGGTTPACVQAIAVADGTEDSFALLSNGSVDSWGSDFGGFQSYTDNDGQLGDNAPAGTMTSTPSPVSTTGAVTAIASGDSHSCALLSNGTVECWGDNTVGELGVATSTFDSSIPIGVPGLANVIAIDVGGTISCALLQGGTVECWGYNGDDELGSTSTASCNGADPCSTTPVAIPGLSGVTAIAIGNASAVLADHACALLGNGTVKCWGYNGNGEAGNGTIATTGGIATPVTVSGITTATAIQGHQYGACALLAGGSVKCWGSGTNGELGNGSVNAAPTPVTVSGLTDAQSLSVGSSSETVCAVRANGSAVCWGFNGNAQLGNGAPSSTLLSSTPVPVSLLTNVAQIAGSAYHMCAVLTSGEVWCWGDNGDDELANDSAYGNYNPTPVPVQW